MECFRCGVTAADGSRFCPSCGADVSDAARAATQTAGGGRESLLETLRRELGGEYQVERELGRGGMAVVFKATEAELGRPVALKVLPPELALNEQIAERFKREARMTAALDHPNIMPVYRVGQVGGIPFIAMKYVEGRSLDTILERQGALPLPVVLLVLRDAAAALAVASERGIIHRDVKGGNIMIDVDGRVMVTDFGIARAVADGALTASGVVVGTPYFMSPEQCAGRPLGPQCDQYSLGVVAYQMISGSVPFDAESLPAIMQHHFFTPIPDLTTVRTDVPRPLVTLVERTLAKKPEERFDTTREMLEAIEAIPLSEAERRDGLAMLRALARGEALATIVTRSAAAAPTIPSLRSYPGGMALWRRVPRRAAAAVLGALLLVGGVIGVAQLRGRPPAALREGVAAYAAGRRADARAAFERAAREHPTLAQPHVYLGRMAREEQDYAEARRELQMAIRLDSRNAAAMREMGSVLLASGDYQLAGRFYQRALRIAPDDRIARGYLGCTLLRLGRRTEGMRMLRQAGDGSWSACAPQRSR